MPVCLTCSEDSAGVTLDEVEALIAAATDEEFVFWPGADFMPANDREFPGRPQQDGGGLLTGLWDGYVFTGLEFAPDVDQTGCRPLFFPEDWPSLTIGAVFLASSFGSGMTRWYRSGDEETGVDIAVSAFYVGELFANVGGASATPFGRKMLQMPITRQGTHGSDTFGQGMSALAFYGTAGS